MDKLQMFLVNNHKHAEGVFSRRQSHQLGAFSDSKCGLGLVNNSVVIMNTIVDLALGFGTVKTNSR